MAAVLLSPATYNLEAMSNRRAPLSSIPNAANSPFRAVAAAASKRSRFDAGLQEDSNCERQPPAKRQALEVKASNIRTPPQKQALNSREDQLFNKKTQNRQPTAFERKLLAAREEQQLEKADKQEKLTTGEEGIRSWQKHYRRLFPTFVFYFESIPDDVRLRCSRQIKALGAVSATSLNKLLIAKMRTDRRKILLERSHPYCYYTSHTGRE